MTIIDGDDDSYDKIDKRWRKSWHNANGRLHRDDGLPAVIWYNGTVVYYKDGNIHRGSNLPAVIYADGSVFYYNNGKKHRDVNQPKVNT